MKQRCRLVILLLMGCLPGLLTGCSSRLLAPLSHSTFADARTGFHLMWDGRFNRAGRSPDGYLLPRGWRVDAVATEPGYLVGSWVLSGSNEVMLAMMRYGTSRNPDSVSHCLDPQAGWGKVETNQVMIGGRPFTHFHLQDAGMSHYLKVEAYRSLYQGRCDAIDLVIQGTDPQVYSPPRQLPFSEKKAMDELHRLLRKVEWLQPATIESFPGGGA